MANKHVDLFKEIMPAVDLGLMDLWDAVEDEGRKEIARDLWNLNRYISSVNGDYEKQAFAVIKVNEYYNKNYNVIQKEHKKLLWQTLCVAGRTGKKEFHPWIKLERKADSSSKAVKLLMEIYPNKKLDEVELIARISTKKEIIELAKQHGYEKVDI